MTVLLLSSPLRTPEEIDLITGTFVTILKEANEISPKTQTSVIQKATRFVEKLEDGYSLPVVQKTIAGILNMAGQVSKTCGMVGDVTNINKTESIPLRSLYHNKTDMMIKVVTFNLKTT